MLTVAEFQRRFPDEEACRKHLFQCRWPDGFHCPRCGHEYYYAVKTRHLYECVECRMQTSVTAGTVMHGTKLPLQFWFLAMFLISSGQPCSARQLAATLSLNYRSALGMLRKIRYALRKENGPHLLSDMGRRIDKLGCETSNEGSTQEEKADSAAVAHVLAKSGEKKPADEKPDVVTRAKRFMLDKAITFIKHTYRSVGREYLPHYIDEFMYRWFGRFDTDRLFGMLNAIVTVPPILAMRL